MATMGKRSSSVLNKLLEEYKQHAEAYHFAQERFREAATCPESPARVLVVLLRKVETADRARGAAWVRIMVHVRIAVHGLKISAAKN